MSPKLSQRDVQNFQGLPDLGGQRNAWDESWREPSAGLRAPGPQASARTLACGLPALPAPTHSACNTEMVILSNAKAATHLSWRGGLAMQRRLGPTKLGRTMPSNLPASNL